VVTQPVGVLTPTVDHGGDVRRYDGLVDEAGRGGVGVLYLRPSYDQVAVDLLGRRALCQHHCARVDTRVRRSRQCRRGRRANKSQPGRCRKVKSEGTKGRERVVGKAVGDECVFIPGKGPGWQMRSGFTAFDVVHQHKFVYSESNKLDSFGGGEPEIFTGTSSVT
jgi:hypothetical protein